MLDLWTHSGDVWRMMERRKVAPMASADCNELLRTSDLPSGRLGLNLSDDQDLDLHRSWEVLLDELWD